MRDDDATPRPTTPSEASAEHASGPDVAVIGGATESGVQILRMRKGHVELGELRAAQEGKPILGESVRLHARDDHPGLYDVETVARGPLAATPKEDAPALPAARKGPAKVSSDAYRAGWESIFRGPGRSGGDLPN